MEQISCVHCGDFFDPSPRHKNQTACKKVKCQKAILLPANFLSLATR